MVAVAIIILFPAMEFLFWALVGSGREKAHLRIYGDIHDWITVKLGNLLIGSLNLVRQAIECVVGIIQWMREVITAISDCFPRKPSNQTAGMDPPPYSAPAKV
ncbi:hypothetical protein BDR07DRAFT_1373425 [Suillus spraguei]|nr:hypothetical protein BDR07DRAFT_1373425 [Suillus spraguei]